MDVYLPVTPLTCFDKSHSNPLLCSLETQEEIHVRQVRRYRVLVTGA